MFECLIKNRNKDGSTSYEYWFDEGKPRCQHIPIPEGAEYFICHKGDDELYFFKDNFEMMYTVVFGDTDSWENSNWDVNINDRLKYMKEHYGSVALWKREDNSMNEDEYFLTKLQAYDVLLNEPEILQCESTDGSWFDIDWTSYHVQNIILDKESKCRLRIKPSLEHVQIGYFEVMEMLADGKVDEIFVSNGNQLSKLETSLYYLQSKYHDKYSRVVEKQITYDQWKNCKKGEFHA